MIARSDHTIASLMVNQAALKRYKELLALLEGLQEDAKNMAMRSEQNVQLPLCKKQYTLTTLD